MLNSYEVIELNKILDEFGFKFPKSKFRCLVEKTIEIWNKLFTRPLIEGLLEDFKNSQKLEDENYRNLNILDFRNSLDYRIEIQDISSFVKGFDNSNTNLNDVHNRELFSLAKKIKRILS